MLVSTLLLQVAFTSHFWFDSPRPCGSRTLFTYGDSKTREVVGASNNQAIWQYDLAVWTGCRYIQSPGSSTVAGYSGTGWLGENGTTVALRKAAVDVDLAAISIPPTVILFNLGSNDAFVGDAVSGNAATWKANLAYIWNAMHTKWPEAQIWYSETWRQGFDTESDTLATWYAAVASGRDYVHKCDNERDWVKGSDDGATMFWDGIHFSVAGSRQKARLAAGCLAQ